MQFSNIGHVSVIAWMEWLCLGLPGQARLWPLSLPTMRKFLKTLTVELGLSSLNLQLSSLRTGGATSLFMTGIPIDHLRFRGRWKSLDTLEHYIQEAIATTVMSNVSPVASATIQHLSCYHHLVQAPPRMPWWQFFSRKRQFAQLK